MKSKSIAILRQMLKDDKLKDEDIEELKTDERKGVQQLVRSYEKKKREEEAKKERFNQLRAFDDAYRKDSTYYIAGVDEAGRGPLAGPVVAAAVILPTSFTAFDLTDSKKISAKTREILYEQIIEEAIAYRIAVVEAKDIDALNILEATKLAMSQAIEGLPHRPQITLIDAEDVKVENTETIAIVKGDQKSLAIAAASILAKVTRDRIMEELDKRYPAYQFAKNKGYGSKEHLEALHTYGPTPEHRRSFSPVQATVKK